MVSAIVKVELKLEWVGGGSGLLEVVVVCEEEGKGGSFRRKGGRRDGGCLMTQKKVNERVRKGQKKIASQRD